MTTQNLSLSTNATPFTDATRVGIDPVGAVNDTTGAQQPGFVENEQVSKYLANQLPGPCTKTFFLLAAITPFIYMGIGIHWAYNDPQPAYVDGCKDDPDIDYPSVNYKDCLICMGTTHKNRPFNPMSTQSHEGKKATHFGQFVPWISPHYDAGGFGWYVIIMGCITLFVMEITIIKFDFQKIMMSLALRRGVYIKVAPMSKMCFMFWPCLCVLVLCFSIVTYDSTANLHGFEIGKGVERECLAPPKYAGQKLYTFFYDNNPTSPAKHKAESRSWWSLIQALILVLPPFGPILWKMYGFAVDSYAYLTLDKQLDSSTGARMLFSHIHSKVTYKSITNAALKHHANTSRTRDTFEYITRYCLGNELDVKTCLTLDDEDVQEFFQELRVNKDLIPIEEEFTLLENNSCI